MSPNIVDRTAFTLEDRSPCNLLQRSVRSMLCRHGFRCPVCTEGGQLRVQLYTEEDSLCCTAICGYCDSKGSARTPLVGVDTLSVDKLAARGRQFFRDLIRDIDSPKRNSLEELMRGATDREDVYRVLLRCAICDLPIGSRAYCPRCGQKVETKDPNSP